MTIEVRRDGNVCIVDLAGALSFPEATAELRTEWKRLLGEGERKFIIDMLDVPWLDSSGIGEVVACFKRAREQGGDVKLVLSAKPYNSFTYCHLDKMFDMFDSLDAALSSLRPDRPQVSNRRQASTGPDRSERTVDP